MNLNLWLRRYREAVVRDVSRFSFLTLRPGRPLSRRRGRHQWRQTSYSLHDEIQKTRREELKVSPHSESRCSRSAYPPKPGLSWISSGAVTAVVSWWSSAALLTGVTLQRPGDEHGLHFLLLYGHLPRLKMQIYGKESQISPEIIKSRMLCFYSQVLHRVLRTPALPSAPVSANSPECYIIILFEVKYI